jgi:pimeloyl-ACP methyl ester carboxylesterase
MIEDPSGQIEYDEQGSGPTLVLVPGSCSTGAAWRPVMKALDGRFRFVTTSLLGYGATAERRAETAPSVLDEAEMLETVIARAGGDVHIAGHSFGGAVALLVAMRSNVKVRSLTVLEAPLPSLLRECGEDGHYQAFRAMTDAYFAAWGAGDREAIRSMIDWYGGAGTWASWPDRVREYAVASTSVNMRDWRCAYDYALSPQMLAGIEAPVSVAVGAASHPAICRANGIVATAIRGATFRSIGGAAHFMISTHPAQVAELIAETVQLSETPGACRPGVGAIQGRTAAARCCQ